MRFLYGVATTLVVLAIGGLLFIYSGIYNIAASDQHTGIGKWALHTAMHRSVSVHSDAVEVPENLVTEDRVQRGARAYDQLCAACHLKPGQDDSLIRQGLNPTPPALAREGHWSAGEQFWIIKHGIRMTGMPAWGETHRDEELWELTAFLQRLPSMSEDQYASLVRRDPSRVAPAGDGHDHEHASMSGMSGNRSTGGGSESEAMAGHHDQAGEHPAGDDDHHNPDQSGGASRQASSNQAADTADEGGEADGHYSDGHTH